MTDSTFNPVSTTATSNPNPSDKDPSTMTTTTTPHDSDPQPVQPPAAHLPATPAPAAAFERRRAEIAAVPDADLNPINLEVRGVCFTISESMPRVAPLRAAIAALPGVDQALIDAAPELSEALWHIQTCLSAAAAEAVQLTAEYNEGVALREVLTSDVKAMIQRGQIQGQRIKEVTGLNGFKNLAGDLSVLAHVLRTDWPRVEGKSAVTTADVDRAAALDVSIRSLLFTRDATSRERAEYAALRQRAYTLTLKAWDEVRRAVSFLRWHHGDANDIAPSLFAGRRGKSDRQESDVPVAPQDAPRSAPPAAPAASPAPGPALGGLPVGEPFVAA